MLLLIKVCLPDTVLLVAVQDKLDQMVFIWENIHVLVEEAGGQAAGCDGAGRSSGVITCPWWSPLKTRRTSSADLGGPGDPPW